MYKILIFVAAILLHLPAFAQGQHNAYTFQHLCIEDGLAGNHVSAILQDRKGFIWIASTALQRYDGKHLITISNFDRLPGSIYYENIALYEDRASRIWMGTPDNIRVYDPLTAKVKVIQLAEGLTIPGSLSCHDITQDHHGVIWATSSLGLLQLDEQTNRFKIPSGIPDSIRQQMKGALLEDSFGRLWISGKYGLYILSNNRKEVYSHHNNPLKIAALDIGASAKKLYEDSKKRMWIGSRGYNHLFVYNPDSNSLKQYQFKLSEKVKEDPFDQVYDMASDILGNIWVAVEHEGLYRYNEKLDSFNLHIPGNKQDELGLHYDYETNCLLNDRDGHLWVGTDRGINIMSLHNETFSRYDHRTRFAGSDLKLPSSEVTGTFTASNGDVYIGYWGKGFAWLDPHLHLKAHYPYDPNGNGITDDHGLAWSFAEMPNGHILVGQENGYVTEFDPLSRKFMHHRPPAFEDETVLTMLPENDSTVWVGLYLHGIVRWNPQQNKVTRYPQLVKLARRYTAVMAIVPQGEDLLWLATTYGGIMRFNKRTGLVEKNVMFRHNEDTVRNIASMLRYNDSILLAGTDHGLYFYNHVRDTWTAQAINAIHFDEWILNMQSAGGEDIWLTTPYGFYRLNGATRTLTAFVQNDDIIDNHRRVRRSITKLQNGQLLVGASDHFISFSISHLQVKPPPPDVTIVNFEVLDSAIIVDSLVGTQFPLILTHDQNFISIEFKSLQYHTEKTRYYYQLEGVDADWVPAENLLVARYTKLPPGDYIFHVKSMNMAGVFSRNTTSLHINVLPAFWQTWWFRALCILAVLAMIYGYFRYRLYTVKKEAKNRAAFREELAQMEMKALRAQMNPHFIFNSLNSIQTFMMKNETEQALSYLSRFARLIRNVLDHSQLNNITIVRETEMLENYLELERLRLNDQFDYKIVIDPLLDKDFLEIPAMVIQPFAENAIWHGLLHKKEKGLLTIAFIRKENKIHCIIEDDGVGREAAMVLKQQSHPTHISRGVQITKDRLQIYNSRYNMDAFFDIEDLKDATGKATGTRINLWFPLLED